MFFFFCSACTRNYAPRCGIVHVTAYEIQIVNRWKSVREVGKEKKRNKYKKVSGALGCVKGEELNMKASTAE